MGIPHLKLDLGRVSEPSSTVTGQSLNPALKRGVLKFGHFHCRVAASERRPAFQGRSRQPNLPTRRTATDEMGNPNGVRDSSAAGAARVPEGGTKVPALKGRPTVKRRDAAAKQAFVCPTNIINRENACFMVGT